MDRLRPLVESRVAIISVCGAKDTLVPIKENTDILEDRYKKLGGIIKVIIKPDVYHHPHSLKDPAPIVRFILKNDKAYRQEGSREVGRI
jgi:alpha-beta hydrolase superfamily lysophospholipase